MAREVTLVYETSTPIAYKVVNGTGIEKGTFLKQADARIASASTGTNDVFAGFAAQEKIASDGKTMLGSYTTGYFKVTASGAITMGCPLKTAAAGNYAMAVTDLSGSNIIGNAEEAADAGHTFLMRLQIQNHTGALSAT